MREPAYRLYNCERCQVQVRICERCDHGNVYCAGGCAKIRRRESLRRAQARYQRSRGGARRHAARQRGWRERERQKPKIVTHQGSPLAVTQCIVAVSPVMQSQPADASQYKPEQRRGSSHIPQSVAAATRFGVDPSASIARAHWRISREIRRGSRDLEY